MTMQEATSEEAVADFARRKLAGTGWELGRVRKRATRLEPPHGYWVIYEITINKDEEERKLRLVARGAFDTGSWETVRDQLTKAGNQWPCDPIESVGYPEVFDETQHAYWFFPFDLALPGLPKAADAKTMWELFNRLDVMTEGGRRPIDRLHVE
ncbi:MAG TPA: hypothetical protein VGP33_00695, partial [Chloroflexota bacterium]|nr:hypothetical protein [Chloroflexota bacterium]